MGVVDAIYPSQLLSLSTNQNGFTFLKYIHSVEPKLGIHLDVSSKNVQRILKVILTWLGDAKRITLLCENTSKTLHFCVDAPLFDGWVSINVFRDYPRITASMDESSYTRIVGGERKHNIGGSISLLPSEGIS